MDKIYILTEYGGSYEDVWERVEAASFDKEYLEQLAQNITKNRKEKSGAAEPIKMLTKYQL